MRAIDSLVIHHSASLEGSVAAFTSEHAQRGFGTIGYHYVIGNGHGIADGHIAPGRPESQKGCGVYGANTGKLHICLVGNFHSTSPGYTGRPSRDQFRALGKWLMNKGTQYRIAAHRVVGHKEITVPGHATACPGDQFPLALVREWYHVSMMPHQNGGQVEPLDQWLTDRAYFRMGARSIPAVALKPVSPTKVFVDDKPVTDFLVYNNHVYLRPASLTLLLNWPQAEWNAETRTLTVRTKTK